MTRAKKTINEVTLKVSEKAERFMNHMETARQESAQAEKEVQKLKEMLAAAEKAQREKDMETNRLKKIFSWASYKGENTPFEWHVSRNQGSTYHKTAWSEVLQYRTSVYDFTVVITERTDLKKMKWVVRVYGTKTTPAEKIYNGSEYRDHSYVVNKYKDKDLEEKFSSEEAARFAVDYWKSKLETDHKEEINAEYVLYKQAQEVPRMKVGSIVEHEVFGRGTVTEHMHADRFMVKFEGSERFKELGKVMEPRPVYEENVKLTQE